MTLEGRFEEGLVVVGGDARQRLHDARGYGYPLEGNRIGLAPVEAAHLLQRGDLAAVSAGAASHDERSFRRECGGEGLEVSLAVFADLRSRGYYLVPARSPWVDAPVSGDFAVFERGSGPPDGAVAHAVTTSGEDRTVAVESLDPGVLAVADGEGEVSYFTVRAQRPPGEGDSNRGLPEEDRLEADLCTDRVLLWDAPDALYERGFYGRPREETLQCSLVEAAYLATKGVLSLDPAAVTEQGRSRVGAAFDRRLAVYTALRGAGAVPKTGFKFGTDFRVYPAVESVDNLGHSSHLVRVVAGQEGVGMRDLARDVRLAHGVRKTVVLAGVTGEKITWRALERMTP